VLEVLIALIDGDTPETWQPYKLKFHQLLPDIRKYRAPPIEEPYEEVGVDYILRPVRSIKDTDTNAIVGVLIDATRFTDQDDCPFLSRHLRQFERLCRTLSRQESAYWRKYGLRFWLVYKPDQKLNHNRAVDLFERAATSILIESAIHPDAIDEETLIIKASKSAADEVARQQVKLCA
jgi:hypothetical protein